MSATGNNGIYLDYAATSPLREEVLEAMLPFFRTTFGNPDSIHSFGREAAYALTTARDEVAEVLGVSPQEVYFTSGGTEANNWAVRCLGEGEALLSPIEHASSLSAAALREGGFRLCQAQSSGIVSADSVERAMRKETGLAVLMQVNNETGCIQPVEELGAICRARGILLFCDCVQAACTRDLRKTLAAADAISLSAHKIGGMKGVGALIVKRSAKIRPLIAGGEQERGLRGGTPNVAGIVGFAKALQLAQAEREEFCAHTKAVRDLFEGELLRARSDRIEIDGENRAPNLSHITVRGGGPSLLQLLDLKGVAASGGAACSAQAARPSHVLMAMGRSEEEAKQGIRFSFGRATTEREALEAAKIILKAI